MIEILAGILIAAGIEKMRRDNDEGGYSETQSYESSSPEAEPQQADQSNSVSEYEHRFHLQHWPHHRDVDGVKVYADTWSGLNKAAGFVRNDKPQGKNVRCVIAQDGLPAPVDSPAQDVRRGDNVRGHADAGRGRIFVNSSSGNFRRNARHEAAHVKYGKDESIAKQAESDRGWWSL